MSLGDISIVIAIIAPVIIGGVSYGIISAMARRNTEDIKSMRDHCSIKHKDVDKTQERFETSLYGLRELVIERFTRLETALGLGLGLYPKKKKGD